MDGSVGSLDALLALADRDEAAGLADAPWPPHFQKADGEAPRVAPSRAKGAAKKASGASGAGTRARTPKMPLITVANSPNKQNDAFLTGLR
jgi:hypothetical protein